MTKGLVLDAPGDGVLVSPPGEGMLHHSDRGGQHASDAFQQRLKEAGIICSMSCKGDCREATEPAERLARKKGEGSSFS